MGGYSITRVELCYPHVRSVVTWTKSNTYEIRLFSLTPLPVCSPSSNFTESYHLVKLYAKKKKINAVTLEKSNW